MKKGHRAMVLEAMVGLYPVAHDTRHEIATNCNGIMLVYNVLLIHCKRGLNSPEVGEICPLNTVRGPSLA
jgi:hypothetical protein